MTPIFRGEIDAKGQFKADNPADFKAHRLRFAGKRVEITIRKERKNRSLAENRYLWAVPVQILADFWGYSPDEAYDIILAKWSREPSDRPGMPDKIIHTSTMDTIQFEDLMERIRRGAAVEFGVYIPEPNEVDYQTGELR